MELSLVLWRPKHHYHYNFIVITLIAVGLSLYAIFRIFFSHAAASDADINGDGVVDVRDLAVLAANFRKTGQNMAQGDLNGDGVVDVRDFSLLAINWGLTTTAGGGGGGTCPAGWPTDPQGVAFPCPATTGVPAAFLASKGVQNADQLPVYTGPTTFTGDAQCGMTSGGATGVVNGVIQGVRINSSIQVNASNGTVSSSTPCLTIKDSIIHGGVSSNYLGSECNTPSQSAVGHGLCGPTVIQDVEINPNADLCGLVCASPPSGVEGPNMHVSRAYIHNFGHPAFFGDVAYDELRDSYMSDTFYSCAATCDPNANNGAGNGLHTAAAAINTGSTGAFITIDHNYMASHWENPSQVGLGGGGFSATFNIYKQRSSSHDNTVNHNYFTADSNQEFFCTYSASINSDNGGSPVTDSWNEVWTNNVFDRAGCDSGSTLPVVHFDPAYAVGSGVRAAITGEYQPNWDQAIDATKPHNNKWCGNTFWPGFATVSDNGSPTTVC